jgi:hypothetical protein
VNKGSTYARRAAGKFSFLTKISVRPSKNPVPVDKLSAFALRDAVAFSNIPRDVDLLPIRERAAKVRVASLHSATELTVARRLSQLWIPHLRSRRAIQHALAKGVPTAYRLKRKPGDLVYSADLSAATDYVPHCVAQFVARELVEVLDMDSAWTEIVTNLFGPKFAEATVGDASSRRKTSGGIHMGLGPTWTILCILNCFAAEHAGATPDSYQVCGDDLIASWPQEIIDGYERNLVRLGLVVNKKKSFRGRRGVFCEQAVSISDSTHITITPSGKLSALTASRFLDDRSRSALGVADGLCQETRSKLCEIAEETRTILMRSRRKLPGPIRLGGCGRGAPTRGRLAALTERRPAAYSRKARDERRTRMQQEVDLVSTTDCPTCPEEDAVLTDEDAIIHIQTALDFVLATRGRRVKIKNLTVKQHSRSYRQKKLSKDQMVKNAKEMLKLPSREVRLVRRLAGKSGKRNRRWLAKVLTRPPAVRYILRSDLLRIIRATLKVDWDSQVREPAGKMPDAQLE